jgi:hypothetical protein
MQVRTSASQAWESMSFSACRSLLTRPNRPDFRRRVGREPHELMLEEDLQRVDEWTRSNLARGTALIGTCAAHIPLDGVDLGNARNEVLALGLTDWRRLGTSPPVVAIEWQPMLEKLLPLRSAKPPSAALATAGNRGHPNRLIQTAPPKMAKSFARESFTSACVRSMIRSS